MMSVKEIQALRDQHAECFCEDSVNIVELCDQLLNEIEIRAGRDI